MHTKTALTYFKTSLAAS